MKRGRNRTKGSIGASNDREGIVRFVPKMTTHPRAEHLGNSLVVGRQRVSRTPGNLNSSLIKGKSASGPWNKRD